MFINFWYAAEESANVTEQPVHVRMLGQDFVLFRDSEGRAHCLSNVCVHRGGSLAHGKVKGDCVECPYHGWQFDGAGACTRIPSMGPDAKIPSRAKVDAYPTFERYGVIFAFLGDVPEDERPPVMEIPEWDDEAWRPTFQRFEFNFNFERSLENSVDLAHNEFVHALQLQIDGESFAIPDFELEDHEDGWEHGFHLTMPGQSQGMRKDAGKTKPGPSTVYTAFHGVSSFRTLIHPAPHIKMHQYIFETPVEEEQTRLFFFNLRSFLIEPANDERTIGENSQVALEDRDVLERLRPVITPRTNAHETFVPADKPIARYRERIKIFESNGWRIDSDEVDRNKDKVAYAIPSPARRTSKGWALDPVPLMDPARTQQAAAE